MTEMEGQTYEDWKPITHRPEREGNDEERFLTIVIVFAVLAHISMIVVIIYCNFCKNCSCKESLDQEQQVSIVNHNTEHRESIRHEPDQISENRIRTRPVPDQDNTDIQTDEVVNIRPVTSWQTSLISRVRDRLTLHQNAEVSNETRNSVNVGNDNLAAEYEESSDENPPSYEEVIRRAPDIDVTTGYYTDYPPTYEDTVQSKQ